MSRRWRAWGGAVRLGGVLLLGLGMLAFSGGTAFRAEEKPDKAKGKDPAKGKPKPAPAKGKDPAKGKGSDKKNKPPRTLDASLEFALINLDWAQGSLQLTKADHGGHRVKALNAVIDAEKHVQALLKAERDRINAAGNKGKGAGPAGKGHPKPQPLSAAAKVQLSNAIQELGWAETDIAAAKHDHGGQREKALKSVRVAVVHLTDLLKYFETHPNK